MTQLLDLPEEIILEIITKFLDLSGCVHLIQVSMIAPRLHDKSSISDL